MKKILVCALGIILTTACSSTDQYEASILKQTPETVSTCERMAPSLNKDRCFRKVAENQNDLNQCHPISDPIQKAICYNGILRKNLSSKVCVGLKTDKKRVNCTYVTYTNLIELVQSCIRTTGTEKCIGDISNSSTSGELCGLHSEDKERRCLKRFAEV